MTATRIEIERARDAALDLLKELTQCDSLVNGSDAESYKQHGGWAAVELASKNQTAREAIRPLLGGLELANPGRLTCAIFSAGNRST